VLGRFQPFSRESHRGFVDTSIATLDAARLRDGPRAGNRDPAPSEVKECLPYLERQIALLNPKLILVVGRIAAHNLLRTEAPLGSLRQRAHQFGVARIPLVVTYHPAYLLRSPVEKRKAWDDLKFARGVLANV